MNPQSKNGIIERANHLRKLENYYGKQHYQLLHLQHQAPMKLMENSTLFWLVVELNWVLQKGIAM